MNKIIIGVVLLIFAGGAFLFFGNSQGQKSSDQETVQVEQKETNTPTQSTSQLKTIEVEGGMFYFKPNEIRVKKGEKVKIVFTNKEGFHDFVLDEFNVKTAQIQGGQKTEVEFTPDKAGTYEYYCSVGNHRQQGMVGKLIVSE